MVKQNYKTEQRKELLDYMIKNSKKFVKADEIEKHLKNKKISVGLTTIYRFLNSLEKNSDIEIELKKEIYQKFDIKDLTEIFIMQYPEEICNVIV